MIAVWLATNGFITTRAVKERPTKAARVLSKVSSVAVESVAGIAAGGAGVAAGGTAVGAGAGGVWAEAVAGTASARSSAKPARLMREPAGGTTGRCQRR